MISTLTSRKQKNNAPMTTVSSSTTTSSHWSQRKERRSSKCSLYVKLLSVLAFVPVLIFWFKSRGAKEFNTQDVVDAFYGGAGRLERYECSAKEAQSQEERIKKRFGEWWSHSACPDQVWMEAFKKQIQGMGKDPVVVMDIGCNKGYTSASFMDLITPADGMNPDSLYKAIKEIEKEDKTTYDRDCGVCNDCKAALNQDNIHAKAHVHCFEPSPATFNMLSRVKEKLNVEAKSGGSAQWYLHNEGLTNATGMLHWHPACDKDVGDELCSIVDNDFPDSIKVPVVTVDKFRQDKLNQGLIHMLKIDAEGLDPAVLEGAKATLESKQAVMVMFEWNPGLREKDPPHGLWGLTPLLQVTNWLDELSYDCYLDSRVKGPDDVEAPAMYLLNGGCVRKDPGVRGWANVVCASRDAYPDLARDLRKQATLVGGQQAEK